MSAQRNDNPPTPDLTFAQADAIAAVFLDLMEKEDAGLLADAKPTESKHAER